MTEKLLGKITKAEFGFGGYQDSMFGLTLYFEGKGWGCADFISAFWSESIKCSPNAKWTEADRSEARVDCIKKIDKLLKEAKVDVVSKLKGIPVEVVFEKRMIVNFRILTEVL